MSLPVQAIWIRRSTCFAGFTCLLYDHIITFDQEVRYIWRTQGSLTKYLFLANRYGNLLGQVFFQIEEAGMIPHVSKKFCEGFNLFVTAFVHLSGESIHILVLLRAWAIWRCKRRIARVLIGTYLVYLIAMLGFIALACSNPDFQRFLYLDIVGMCIGVVPPYSWLISVASFVLDTIVFAITMRSLLQYSRDGQCLYPSQLVQRLVEDASMFYIATVLYNLVMLIAFTVYASDPRSFILISVASPTLSIAGQRLVLNLRSLRVRSHSPRSISAEVDRQIGAIEEAQPEWWRSKDSGGRKSAGDVADGTPDEGLQNDLRTWGMVAADGDSDSDDEVVIGARDVIVEESEAIELADMERAGWAPVPSGSRTRTPYSPNEVV